MKLTVLHYDFIFFPAIKCKYSQMTPNLFYDQRKLIKKLHSNFRYLYLAITETSLT